jgi:pilus assembly protein CpaC
MLTTKTGSQGTMQAIQDIGHRMQRIFCAIALTGAMALAATTAQAEEITLPVNRAELITTSKDMAEVMIANPDVADIHVHSATKLSIIGKQIGRTSLRIFDKEGNILRSSDVFVSYDLPAIRKALNEFLPNDVIGVKLVNTNLALVGEVRDATAIEQAMQIVNEFVKDQANTATAANNGNSPLPDPKIINLLSLTSGQQVMLRVRVGEIQRTALKRLGATVSGGKVGGRVGVVGGANRLSWSDEGAFVPGDIVGDREEMFGFLAGNLSTSSLSLSAALDAMETQGLFKVLAEPNLVALSGEQAEFLAGGEFPVPTVTGTGASAAQGVQYKKYGVSVQFMPFVLSENRIRLAVAPEVSELSEPAAPIAGVSLPTLNTRRAKTTVELAPGESFMIAGLIRDNLNAVVRQLPGISEIPIFSALLRSTSYSRNETELVITVTPYLVDPMKASDIRLPTDGFKTASTMEQFFYGALSAISESSVRRAETPQLEGPIGFMVD